MTANALTGMREKFLEGGFDDYLAKPVELSSLNAVLERWIPEGKRLAPARIAESGDAAAAPVEIAGLDTARGLAAAGGTWDNYLKVLRMFQLDAADRLPFLKSVAGAPGGPADASSARRLITEAHALKSALANIGALDLSRDAAALEELGRNGDLEAAGTALGPFCEALSSLSGRIAEALAVRGAAGRGAGAADGGAAPDLDVWRRLREALISTDPEAIDAISSELQSSPNPLDRDSIARVSDHVLVADFGKAVEEIDAFLATL
jgi:HPt (histidine-containing phosphotransfer) domain-containing protein